MLENGNHSAISGWTKSSKLKDKFLKYKTKEEEVSWTEATILTFLGNVSCGLAFRDSDLPQCCSSSVAFFQNFSHSLGPYVLAIHLCYVSGL